MYTNGAHHLICMVIIHSHFNDPPQHPQLNDYSFIYFQLFIDALVFFATNYCHPICSYWRRLRGEALGS